MLSTGVSKQGQLGLDNPPNHSNTNVRKIPTFLYCPSGQVLRRGSLDNTMPFSTTVFQYQHQQSVKLYTATVYKL